MQLIFIQNSKPLIVYNKMLTPFTQKIQMSNHGGTIHLNFYLSLVSHPLISSTNFTIQTVLLQMLLNLHLAFVHSPIR
jgi:hypothetical protein